MKIEEFEDIIEQDLAWRKVEISQLFVILNDTETKEVVTKSIILLLYAHWEGFLKKSFKYYLKYISELNVKLCELTYNFKAIVLKEYAHQCIDNDSLNLCKELQFMSAQNKMNNKKFIAKVNVDDDLDEDIINTKHNLSSKVLKNICEIIGIKYNDAMKARATYVDAMLLKHRNSIGHAGKMANKDEMQDNNFSYEQLKKLKDFIITMLNYYAKILGDYIELKLYLICNEKEKEKYEKQQEKKLLATLEKIA